MAYALGGFLLWGISPLYWKLLAHVPALETVLHRVLWSGLFMSALLVSRARRRELAAVWRDGGTRLVLLATSALIGFNWFVYIWAINNERVLEASLGYFINPLVNVALGMLFLKERLRPAQAAALALAAAGVLNLLLFHGRVPWVALSLALSFGAYAWLRKTARVSALSGLAVESWILAPLCAPGLLWIGAQGQGRFGLDFATDALLVGGVLITALPLWWFTEGARRLSLRTLGMMQYISPSAQFLLGALVFREPLSPRLLLTFGLIWAGLALFTLTLRRG